MKKLITYTSILLFLIYPDSGIASDTLRVAIIGDYGSARSAEGDVANLVKSWNPDLIITTGDNNYEDGLASTIDDNIGQYYHDYISPYLGSYGAGADINRFFPSLGNHDYRCTICPQPYLDYFTLPNNERYYDFKWGPVHFFSISSDSKEPDGINSSSIQALWLKTTMSESTQPLKIVYMHHPPFSSSSHGSTEIMQWPFKEWGADAVIAGHDHVYERIILDGLPYFVNGLGGKSIYHFSVFVSGSEVRYRGDYGAMLVEITNEVALYKFINRSGELIDSYQYTIVSVEPERAGIPAEFVLSQNYPNPFNPETVIEYEIPIRSEINLIIYNLRGQKVITLIKGEMPAGNHNISWDASNLPSGIYFYRLQAGDFVQTRKMVLLK
ncbi:T9SS type A sorting domain-containing protein [Candidatus Marinimicrobia bacterium MT.SAG.4]|nr:T9SS type A sorting domain-containing protein [Candidatus Marinimicrobia bacterium MT.SAG.4]